MCILSWVGWFDEFLLLMFSVVFSIYDLRWDVIVLLLGSSKMWEEVGLFFDKFVVGICVFFF